MNSRHWQKVKALLDEALERDTTERSDYLSHACGGDTVLLAEVERLLRLEDEAESFIETPLVDLRSGNGQPTGPRPLIDRYRVIDEIGRGGMGAVYLAERADQEFEQRVAVKVLKRGLDTDEIVGRFRAERQILAGLEHPNVARLIDGGTTGDGLPYFVLEHVEGRPIDRYCDEEGLGLEERLALLRKVCDAVAYAHRNLVIHRDLKPGNILVTAEGKPKLLDFGIAKLLSPEPSQAYATRAGFQFLTPEYAAPEQISGEGVDTTTDVYLLGLLLYRLVAGELPFDRDDRSPERLEKHPPAPSIKTRPEWRKAVAGDLDRIVGKALHPERGRRYGSVEQLSEDLRRFLEGMPVQATPDSFLYRAGKFTRRHRAWVGATAAFVLVVMAFGVVSNVLMRRARNQQELAEQVMELFVGTFAQADPETSGGENLTVKAALDEAVATIREAGRENRLRRDIQADLEDLLGRVYINLGLYKQAQPLFEHSLEIRRGLYGQNDPRIGRSLANVAHVSFLQRDKSAGLWLRQVVEFYRRHDNQSANYFRALNNLAVIERNQGNAAESKRLLLELLPRQQSLYGETLPEDISDSLHNLGLARLDLGEYEDAVRHLQDALTRRQHLGLQSKTAASLNSLASALERMGQVAEAVPLYEEAVAIQRQLYTGTHPKMAPALNNLALVRRDLGDFDQAQLLLLEALAIDQVAPPTRSRLLRNLATVQTAMAEGLAAEASAREALTLLEQSGAPAPPKADAESVLGETLAVQGRFTEAEPLLLNGYSMLTSLNGPDNRYTQEALDRLIGFYATTGQLDLAERYRVIRHGEVPPAETLPTAATPFEIDLM